MLAVLLAIDGNGQPTCPALTARELSAAADVSGQALRDVLTAMRKVGLVRRVPRSMPARFVADGDSELAEALAHVLRVTATMPEALLEDVSIPAEDD